MFSDHFVNRDESESSAPDLPLNYRHRLHGQKRSSDPVLVPSSQTLSTKFDPITTFSLHGIPGYAAKNCSFLLKDSISLSESPGRTKTKRPAHHGDAKIESRTSLPGRLKKHTAGSLRTSTNGCDLHITRLKFSPHEFSHRKVLTQASNPERSKERYKGEVSTTDPRSSGTVCQELLARQEICEPVLSIMEDSDEEKGCRDDLFLLEIERRRERDFGQVISSASYSCPERELEPDCECDSLCTENESEDRLSVQSDIDSLQMQEEENAAVKEPSDLLRESYSVASLQNKKMISQFHVPVASSLIAIPPSFESSKPSPPLTPSIFPEYFPATIHFPLHNENCLPFPKEVRALLKWRVCSITPNIVKSCSSRAGFSKCTRGDMWMGYWGKHMKAEAFRLIKEYQKVNHFPGTFQIGRKDRLWRNLFRLQARVGKKHCNFVPQTYVLPHDLSLLKKDWEEAGKQKWILKPPASARGIGIRVVNRWKDIPKRKPVIIQRYLSNPYLINGVKFDLRIYVLVSSYDPLKIYVFREGLARFATCKYSSSFKHISNRFMHLTNYSINKHNADFTPNTDETVCQGHKWGLLALWRYMTLELGLNTECIWESIKDVVVQTIISSEHYVTSNIKAYVRNSSSVFELFGFDIMLDNNLKPWILEVNISPSLHSNSQLDINIKGRLVRDLFNICGFKLYSKEILMGMDTPPRSPSLTPQERSKHSYYMQRSLKMEERKKILDNLTHDDIRTLMQAEDEFSRRGFFERVYPSNDSLKYRKFFEAERYYNVLLSHWAEKYDNFTNKGMRYLQKLAKELKMETINS